MLNLDLDNASSESSNSLPSQEDFERWLRPCISHSQRPSASVSIRIVDEAESLQLNNQYRGKNQPTNVLSFACDLPPDVELDLLGDLVICAPVVVREAQEQGKNTPSHWAHMAVHGCLHLLGYDHIEDSDAEIMEALETTILTGLDFPAPYEQ